MCQKHVYQSVIAVSKQTVGVGLTQDQANPSAITQVDGAIKLLQCKVKLRRLCKFKVDAKQP